MLDTETYAYSCLFMEKPVKVFSALKKYILVLEEYKFIFEVILEIACQQRKTRSKAMRSHALQFQGNLKTLT